MRISARAPLAGPVSSWLSAVFLAGVADADTSSVEPARDRRGAEPDSDRIVGGPFVRTHGTGESTPVRGKSQIATLVERTSRFAMLVRIPYDRTAERVAALLAQKMETLPEFLRNSVTWDQGTEMARHAEFTVRTGLPVYFCDPHSPWQRGTNENTNGLLRQYFPKGTDLSLHTQEELDRVATELNGRPRKTLGWKKPIEVFEKLIAEHCVAMTD
jgi:transposase, IS30 family